MSKGRPIRRMLWVPKDRPLQIDLLFFGLVVFAVFYVVPRIDVKQ